jgi:hypothetical protein
MTYKFHIDPGHGWLEVPMAELEELGIADHISSCSYRDGDTAYLEEDCDFATFLAAKVDGYTPNDYRAAFKRLDRIIARVTDHRPSKGLGQKQHRRCPPRRPRRP